MRMSGKRIELKIVKKSLQCIFSYVHTISKTKKSIGFFDGFLVSLEQCCLSDQGGYEHKK